MATIRWLGAAQDVPQITPVTIALTWATGDKASLTINKKTLTLTLGTDATTADVASELYYAWNATSATANLAGATLDESRNVGGQEIPEFNGIKATVSGSVVTLTGPPGEPFTVTRSSVTAGDGTLTVGPNTQEATGKHFWDNVDNWEGGVVPANIDTINGDTALFDFGSVDVKYALDNTEQNISIVREDTYTGNIGLPQIHATYGYVEYRKRFLDLPVTSGTGIQHHRLGSPCKSQTAISGFTYIDLGTNTGSLVTLIVNAAPAANATTREAVQVVGSGQIEVDVLLGSLSLGAHPGENPTTISSLETQYNSSGSDAYVRVGVNALFTNVSDTITHGFGTLDLEANCSGASNQIRVYGATMRVAPGVALNELYIYEGGLVDYRSDTIATLHVYSKGTFDLSRAVDLLTISSPPIVLYKDCTYKDPFGRNVVALEFNGCGLEDVTLETKPNMIWTASTPSSPIQAV